MNLEIDAKKLSIPARQTLETLDRYIDFWSDHDRGMKLTVLDLYRERWDELETSIRHQTDGEQSLETHDYRGLKLVKWDGN
jgi:hypothetical protein